MSRELDALAAVDLSGFTLTEDDVWSDSTYHVDGLHPRVTHELQRAVHEAAGKQGPSPRGIVIRGRTGAGKTHLLGWTRARVQAAGGYFFLVKLLTGTGFWASAVHGLRDNLLIAGPDGVYQLSRLLHGLADRIGLSPKARAAIVGESPLSRADLDEFVRALRRQAPRVGTEAQATARALVLYLADSDASEVGKSYLELVDVAEEGAAWGIRQGMRNAQLVFRDMSRLLALTGPVVVAIDQIDPLITSSRNSLLATHKTIDDPAFRAQLSDIGTGMMTLREETQRTLLVVACQPDSWQLIIDNTVASVAGRFIVLPELQAVPKADVAAAIIERRLIPAYTRAGFVPPYPSWPIRPSAFQEAAHRYTARRLLDRIGDHISGCVASGQVVELEHLADGSPAPTTTGRATSPLDPETIDQRFAELRSNTDPDVMALPSNEDAYLPDVLAAGLHCLVMERGEEKSALRVDDIRGKKPSLHARLRLVLDEATEDEQHWAFRAIAADHALAVQSRLRAAQVESGIKAGTTDRRLFVLRNTTWPRGARTKEMIDALVAAGGVAATISGDDLRTLAALRGLLRERPAGLEAWLRLRRPASETALFRLALADLPAPQTDAASLVDDERSLNTPSGQLNTVGGGTADEGPPVAVVGVRPADGRRFAVPIELLRKHTLVVAGSGAGKTVLVRRIVEQCALRGVSAIVLDPNGDLARLGDAWPEPPAEWSDEDREEADQYLAETEVLIWTPGRTKGRPLVFDPLPDFRPVLGDRDEFDRMLQTSVASLIPRAKVSGRSQRAAWQEAVLSSALEYYVRNGGRRLEGLIQLMRELPPDITTIAAGPRLAADMADTLTAAMRTDRLFGGDGDALDPGISLNRPPASRPASRSSASSAYPLKTTGKASSTS
jgi:hypothetical protein